MKRIDLLKEQLKFLKEQGASEEAIAEIEKKITKSKNGRKSKSKGANYERILIGLLKKYFPFVEFARTPMSGGFHKNSSKESLRGDISCLSDTIDFKLHLEAKNHKKFAVNEWWKQAIDDCPKGKIPCLLMHRGQEIKNGKRVLASEDFILLRFEDFLDIVNQEKIFLDKN